MKQYRKCSIDTKIALFLCAAFLMCFFAIPFNHTNDANSISEPVNQKNQFKFQNLIVTYDNAYYFNEFLGNDILSSAEYKLIESRNSRYFLSSILRIFTVILAFIGIGVFIYCFRLFNRRSYHLKSILASSLGGHSPPKIS